MKNWENQKFESAWRKAFNGAELTPSDSVWQSLDIHLIQAENATMRKRVLFYQRMAAASVAVLFLLGGYFVFYINDSITDQSISSSNQAGLLNGNPSSAQPNSGTVENKNRIPDETKVLTSVNPTAAQSPKISAHVLNSKVQFAENKIIGFADSQHENPISLANTNESDITHKKIFFVSNDQVATVAPLPLDNLPDIFMPNDYSIAYRLADLRPASKSKSKKKPYQSENTWATVGFATGNYMPGAGGGELLQVSNTSKVMYTTLQDSRSTSVKDEKVQPGTSLSFMVSVGKRIFKRWVLNGGLNYLNQTSNSQTSVLSVAPANQLTATGTLLLQSTQAVTYSTPSEINSTFQFISVPIQTGYMIVDRKLGVQINGGISPDFFLRNTVYDQSTEQEIVNSATGSNESFRAVSLAGIGGVEVSYRFSKHYRVSLAPGLRYSLTPVYKDNSLTSSKPLVADIGLRFKYMFNN